MVKMPVAVKSLTILAVLRRDLKDMLALLKHLVGLNMSLPLFPHVVLAPTESSTSTITMVMVPVAVKSSTILAVLPWDLKDLIALLKLLVGLKMSLLR
jgi:hypothetical protein